MCAVLSVSRSGYYAWKSRSHSIRRRDDRRMISAIRAIHRESRGCYGSPRIYRELKQRGVRCGRGRIARLMRRSQLRGKASRRRKPRMPMVDRSNLPNHLQRDFETGRINQRWTADLTYIRTEEGWLFLAVVLDVGSRRVIGWAMGSRPDTDLTVKALDMAIVQRRPQPGVVHHCDRGIHYANARYCAMLTRHGLVASFSRLGNCWDNAVTESFFHTLKTEETRGTRYKTRREAKRRLFEFIEVWYNRKRRHSSLGYVSPEEFECRP